MKLPPIEMTPELTAAVERHVAMLDQAATAEAAGGEAQSVPATDSSGNNGSSQRTAATLDRLAAASLRRGDNGSSGDGGPPIDRTRFVQRVEGAMKAAQQRDGRVQVRLAPPELGSLRIELSVQNGIMSAKLEAETSAARNALLDNLPALRERLAEQNIRVEKFDVDVRSDSQSSGGNADMQDGRPEHKESGSQDRRERATSVQTRKPGLKPPTAAINSDAAAGLDVRI
jgi:flagellar hook-length control protein FliK